MKLLNFGSMNLDHVYQVDHFVRPSETLSVTQQVTVPGGKGLNQSISLSRAGISVRHGGCVGPDGGSLITLLQENGVDTSLIRPVKTAQGHTVIQVDPSGENSILLFGGSNHCVTEAQIEETLSCLQAGDWLILQNELNLLSELVDQAYAKGIRIVLNPSPFNEKLDSVDFDKLAWILVNELEAKQLSGCEDPEEAWMVLHERYPHLSILITLGGEGSLAWQITDGAITFCRQPVFPVEAVDTTGAGDTYTGYFIGGLLEGRPLADCMRRASMASAIAVTRLGAARSIPTKQEVEEALCSMTNSTN